MQCDLCGKKGVITRHIVRSYGKGKNMLVIENVPIAMCPHCGQSYLTSETLHEIERIKLHRRNIAMKRFVAVAEYALGA